MAKATIGKQVIIGPPYPGDKDGRVEIGYDCSASPPFIPTGFEYQGAQYAFLHAGGLDGPGPFGRLDADEMIHAFKSTDGGATWIEKDAGNAPLLMEPGPTSPYRVRAMCTCRDGTLVYLVIFRGHVDTPAVTSPAPVIFDGLTVVLFHLPGGSDPLLFDTWGQSTEYESDVGTTPTVQRIKANLVHMGLIRRAPGDMILYYSGPSDGMVIDIPPLPPPIGGPAVTHDKARVYYSKFDGMNFYGLDEVKLPGQAEEYMLEIWPWDAVVDSTGVSHFFYAPAYHDVWHIAMIDGTEGPMFGPKDTVTSAKWLGNLSGYGTFSAPFLFTAGGTEYIGMAGLCSSSDPDQPDLQEMRFFYAATEGAARKPGDAPGRLTWNESFISRGDYGGPGSRWDPNVLYNPIDISQPISVSVAFVDGFILCTWNWTSLDIVEDKIVGFVVMSYSEFPAFAWSVPAITVKDEHGNDVLAPVAIIAAPFNYIEAVQLYSWTMPATKRIGVLLNTIDLSSGAVPLPPEDLHGGEEMTLFNWITFEAPTNRVWIGKGVGDKAGTNRVYFGD